MKARSITMILTAAMIMAMAAQAEPVRLPNNTVVVVKATEEISAKSVQTGQEIVLVVSSSVQVNGQTVIKAGAPVVAFVDDSKGAQMAGIAGRLALSFRSTVAVDGTTVPLTGQMVNAGDSEVGATVATGAILCPLALLNKGKTGMIASGAEVRGMSIGDFAIDVDHPVEIQYLSTEAKRPVEQGKKAKRVDEDNL
ncbi:MAG: hypothetical protein IPG61_09540 [bacterium]|nr:hypothetical protein [bacterium]